MILLALQLLDLLTTAAALHLGATEWNPVVRFMLAQEGGWALVVFSKLWLAGAIWMLVGFSDLPGAKERCRKVARAAVVGYCVVVASNALTLWAAAQDGHADRVSVQPHVMAGR